MWKSLRLVIQLEWSFQYQIIIIYFLRNLNLSRLQIQKGRRRGFLKNVGVGKAPYYTVAARYTGTDASLGFYGNLDPCCNCESRTHCDSRTHLFNNNKRSFYHKFGREWELGKAIAKMCVYMNLVQRKMEEIEYLEEYEDIVLNPGKLKRHTKYL